MLQNPEQTNRSTQQSGCSFGRDQLVAEIQALLELNKKDAKDVVNGVLGSIANFLLQGHRVSIQGFGRFEMRKRPAYRCHMVFFHEGKMVDDYVGLCRAKKQVYFYPSKDLIKFINSKKG